MNRRDFIGAISAATAGLAGCLDSSTTPSVSDKPLSDYNCPPSGINDSYFVCTGSPEETDGPLTLTSSADETTDISEVKLTLRNVSAEKIGFNPGNWEAWVEQSGEWKRIEQTAYGDGVEELDPGYTYRTDAVTAVDAIRNREYDFSPGTYFLAKTYREHSPSTLFRFI